MKATCTNDRFIKVCETKSTARLQPDQEFLTEAVKLIGNIVRARSFCAQNGKERLLVPYSVKAPVEAQYHAYRNKWKPIGVARFMVRYHTNLSTMATGGVNQRNQLNNLVNQSKQIIDEEIRKTSTRPC